MRRKILSLILGFSAILVLDACVSKMKYLDLKEQADAYIRDRDFTTAELAKWRDSDGDGQIDTKDGCPDDPNKAGPGACGCGMLDTDSDGDGTPDCIDRCPDYQGLPEDAGCPAQSSVGNSAPPSYSEMVEGMRRAYPNETAALDRTRSTVVHGTDTVVIGATNRLGRLVYYCPSHLRVKQRGQIVVTLGELMVDTILRERLLAQVNKRQTQLKEDLITEEDMLSGDVRMSDLVYVHLRGDTGFFDVQKNHLKDTASTTDAGVDEWRWTISPKEGTEGLDAEIEIVVVALDAQGNSLYNDDAAFSVTIALKYEIWQAFWLAMGSDPKWTATTIAIPLISFLFGRWSNRKKEGEQKTNG